MHLKPSIESMLFNTNNIKTRKVFCQNYTDSDIIKWSLMKSIFLKVANKNMDNGVQTKKSINLINEA